MSTKISWTDETFNPVVGCTKVSTGCRSCYALRMAWRLAHSDKPQVRAAYQGVVEKKDGVIRWTGKVNLLRERLGQPLQWKKGRRIFVPSMGDLLHKNVPDEFIFDVLTVVAKCPQHTFQLLTKRAGRLAHLWRKARVDAYPNLWIGVSAENQATADERIPLLLQTPAVVRFVSCEPLLESLDLERYLMSCNNCGNRGSSGYVNYEKSLCRACVKTNEGPSLDQVIVGCETGPKARPMELDWARSLRDQCQESRVAFFYKQGPDCSSMNEFRLAKAPLTNLLDGRKWSEMPG